MLRSCIVCITVYDDFRCESVCPHYPRHAPACRFCGLPVAARCAWPSELFVRVLYRHLKVGDRVKRTIESDALSLRPAASILHIEPIELKGYIDAMRIVLGIGGRQKEIEVRGYSPVLVLRQQPCQMPVCENHLRRVEDGVEYCADHWHAWSEVA